MDQNLKEKLKTYLSDIRFWLFFHFCLRLIGITNPPFETAAWRQVIVAMVAKNFVMGDFNLFLPKMDYFFMSMETTSGISPMEFPLMNALAALLSLVFGWHDWHLRLVNLIVSTFGIWYFYRLIKLFFTERLAFYASFILLHSIWWAYSRKMMPDTFSMALCLIALFYAFVFFQEQTRKKQVITFLLFLILGTAGMLAKIPSSFIFGLLLFPLLNRQIPNLKKILFLAFSLPSLLMVGWWYFYWGPYLVEKYNNRMFFMGKGLIEGFKEIQPYWTGLFEHFYKFAFSYSGFALCLLALYFLFKKKAKLEMQIIALMTLAFSVFILKSGYNFVHHSYYIIPFVPVLAFVAAYGVEQVNKKQVITILLMVFAVDNFLRHQHDLRVPKRDHYRATIPALIDSYIPKSDLIAVNGGASPVDMYNMGRRGYSLSEEELTQANFDLLKKRQIRYLVINRHGTTKNFSEKIIFKNEDLMILDLLPTTN